MIKINNKLYSTYIIYSYSNNSYFSYFQIPKCSNCVNYEQYKHYCNFYKENSFIARFNQKKCGFIGKNYLPKHN
jgi:hypothetical protein